MTIKRVTVVGAGTMGHGIGQEFARAGHSVVLHDVSGEQLQKAWQRIQHNLEELAGWGIIARDEIQPILGRIHTTTCLGEAAADADLVIEAIFENLELKREVLSKLDRLCPVRTILGSNTSSLMPSTLATATQRPDRVLVVHFFFPPPLMPLVEIVRGEQTADEVVGAVYAVLKAAGKSPIIVQKEALGFIANRLQLALLREALYIIEQGIASAQDVDLAVKESFGRRLSIAGPIEMAEVQDGWDVIQQVQKYIQGDLDVSRGPSPLLARKIEAGELGLKSGKGFYEWTPESAETWRQRLTARLAGFLRQK